MTVRFNTTTRIEAPIEKVFDLATSIDLHLESMAASREQAVAGVTSGTIGLHQCVTWKAWHFGIPWRMTSVITEYVRNERFADEQLHGPFKRLHHIHTFEAKDGVTIMHDEIEFDAPIGFIGNVVEFAYLGGYMRKLIDQRNAHLKLVAER